MNHVLGRIVLIEGAIAQGHHEIGGPTLADCEMDILVPYVIFLKGTYILEHLGSWLLGLTASLLAGKQPLIYTGHPQIQGNAPKIIFKWQLCLHIH